MSQPRSSRLLKFWNRPYSDVMLTCVGLALLFVSLNAFELTEAIPLFNIIALAIVVLGPFVARHPLFRASYRDWLKTTPWQPGQPLPLGDVMLGQKDALLIAFGTVLSFQSPLPSMLMVPITVCAMHLLMVLNSLFITKIKFELYCLLFAVVAVLWLIPNTIWIAITLLALEPLKRRGHRRSLETYPWDHIKKLPIEGKRIREPGLGDYLSIRSDMEIEDFAHTEAIAISLLLGLFGLRIGGLLATAYGLTTSTRELVNLLRMLVITLPLAFAAMRLVQYKLNYAPPIDVFGRFFTGRWILPDHDRVFLAPIALVLLAITFAAIVPFAPAIVFAVGWGVSSYVYLTGKPTMREWIYTGQLRFGTKFNGYPQR